MNVTFIPIIKVKDKGTGREHIVGTDSHDVLTIENNAIHYFNLQCACGTKYEEYAYEFVGKEPDKYEDEYTIELVTLDEFIEIYSKILREQNEDERKEKAIIQAFARRINAERKRAEKMRMRKGYIFHT